MDITLSPFHFEYEDDDDSPDAYAYAELQHLKTWATRHFEKVFHVLPQLQQELNAKDQQILQLQQRVNALEEVVEACHDALERLPTTEQLRDWISASAQDTKQHADTAADRLWQHTKRTNLMMHIKSTARQPSLRELKTMFRVEDEDLLEVQQLNTRNQHQPRETLLYRVIFRTKPARDSVFDRRAEILQQSGIDIKADTTYMQRRQWQDLTRAQDILLAVGVQVHRPNLYTLIAQVEGAQPVRVTSISQATDIANRVHPSGQRQRQEQNTPANQHNTTPQPPNSDVPTTQRTTPQARSSSTRGGRGGRGGRMTTRSSSRIPTSSQRTRDVHTHDEDSDDNLHIDPDAQLPSPPPQPPQPPQPQSYAAAARRQPVPLATPSTRPQPTPHAAQSSYQLRSRPHSQQQQDIQEQQTQQQEPARPDRAVQLERLKASRASTSSLPHNHQDRILMRTNAYALLATQEDEQIHHLHDHVDNNQ